MTDHQYGRDVAAARAAYADGIAEGERRATAAIVVWLQTQPSYRVNRSVIAQLQACDHLTEAIPRIEAETVERCAKVADECPIYPKGRRWSLTTAAREDIAAAIRNLEHGK